MATLFYEESGIVLYHGDCLEVLPALTDDIADHTITDPPYSAHVHDVGRMDRAIRAGERDFGFEALTPDVRATVAQHIARLSQRWALVFTDAEGQSAWQNDMGAAGLEHIRVGAWVKPGALPQMSGDRPSAGFETIEISHRPGRKRWNGGGRPAVWTHSVERSGRVHPTQKPLRLLTELLAQFTDPGDVILDPFAGSGTLLRAAKDLGRRAIGIERSEQYCTEIVKRLRQGVLFAEGR